MALSELKSTLRAGPQGSWLPRIVMRGVIVALVLVLAATAHAAPSSRRCERVCSWVVAHCSNGLFNPLRRPRRCGRPIIARCACSPVTTSSSSTTSTTTETTTSTAPAPISGHVTLTLIDDCASEHTCTAAHPDDDSCPEPFFDATVSIGAIAQDGTFTMQLDLGDLWDTYTCPGRTEDVCFDDGENTWCSPQHVATCVPWQHVIVNGTYIKFLAGSTSPSGCNDVWDGTVVP